MAANPQTAVIPIRQRPLAAAPFATWLFKDAVGAVKAMLPADYATRKLYGESESHWDSGKGYIGVLPSPGDPDREEAERMFAQYDGCGEALRNVANAFANEAQIGAVPLEPAGPEGTPSKEQEALGKELVGHLTVLWDRVLLHEHVKKAIRAALYAEHAAIRWWLPPGRQTVPIDADGNPTGPAVVPRNTDIAQAASMLALSRPTPDAGAVVTDEPTQERAAVYLDKESIGGREVGRARIEYLKAGKLQARTVWENDEKKAEDVEIGAPALPMAEMTAENLLTPAVITIQRSLDFAETVGNKTVQGAGFRERTIGNAEPFGKRRALSSPDQQTSGTYLWSDGNGNLIEITPEQRALGNSRTTELVGLSSVDTQTGARIYATPFYQVEEPTDPEFAIKMGRHRRRQLLELCHQGHLTNDSTAESSGLAYIQHRAGFEKLLLNLKGSAERMTAELLTGAVGLIEAITGKVGHYTGVLRITVDMHVDAGPRSPEERTEDRADVQAGLLSDESAMSRGGVEDIQAEQARIAAQPAARLNMLVKVAEVFDSLSRSLDAERAVAALIAAGVEPEIANALKPGDGGPVTEQ